MLMAIISYRVTVPRVRVDYTVKRTIQGVAIVPAHHSQLVWKMNPSVTRDTSVWTVNQVMDMTAMENV